MRIHVLVQRNHLFGKTNTQKTVVKVKTLRTEEKPSFVYLCICVSGQRNHSLTPRIANGPHLQMSQDSFANEALILAFMQTSQLICKILPFFPSLEDT